MVAASFSLPDSCITKFSSTLYSKRITVKPSYLHVSIVLNVYGIHNKNLLSDDPVNGRFLLSNSEWLRCCRFWLRLGHFLTFSGVVFTRFVHQRGLSLGTR